ncbi:hypothetical protein M885DRAFT_533856 [Pelagophyceae sp. CCMP2097]|nr:hypothetical protein M885DRAFT_533856 [Pelagophyceae sp. CCMP2097]
MSRFSDESVSSACVPLADGAGGGLFHELFGCGFLSCAEEAPACDGESPTNSDQAEELLNDAELAERQHNYPAASDFYKKALRLDPFNATAHNNFGYLCSTHTRDFASAEHHYRQAIKCSPDYALAHNNLAYFLKKNKHDLAGAEEHYREAIRCDPEYAFAHSNLGVLLKSKRDFGGAEAHYLAAIRSNPRYAPAFLNYSLLLKSVDEQASREYLDRAVSIDSSLRETPAARSLFRAFGAEAAEAKAAGDREPQHFPRFSTKPPPAV